jgi:hypothetical protein
MRLYLIEASHGDANLGRDRDRSGAITRQDEGCSGVRGLLVSLLSYLMTVIWAHIGLVIARTGSTMAG